MVTALLLRGDGRQRRGLEYVFQERSQQSVQGNNVAAGSYPRGSMVRRLHNGLVERLSHFP